MPTRILDAVADLSLIFDEFGPSAGGRNGAYIYAVATCGCHFARNYPYAVGPRFGIAYTIDPEDSLSR